jgi:hypothetical protein
LSTQQPKTSQCENVAGLPAIANRRESGGLLDHDPEMPLEGDFAISSDGNDSRTSFSLDPLSLPKKIKQSCSGGSSDMEFAFGPIETLTHKGPLTVGAQTIQINLELLEPALSSGREAEGMPRSSPQISCALRVHTLIAG